MALSSAYSRIDVGSGQSVVGERERWQSEQVTHQHAEVQRNQRAARMPMKFAGEGKLGAESQSHRDAADARGGPRTSTSHRIAATASINEAMYQHGESNEQKETGRDEVEVWRGVHAKCDGKPQRRRVSMAESQRAKGSRRHERSGSDPRWIIMRGRKKSREEQSKRVIRGEESEGRAMQPREARQSAGSRSEPQSHCVHDPGVVVNRCRRSSKSVRAKESNAVGSPGKRERERKRIDRSGSVGNASWLSLLGFLAPSLRGEAGGGALTEGVAASGASGCRWWRCAG